MPHPTRLRPIALQAGPRTVRSIKRFLLPTILLTASVSVAGLWRAGYALEASAQQAPSASPSSASRVAPAGWRPDAQQNESPESELITITPSGFDPAEITRPAGRFILAVDNRSGLEEVTIILRDNSGQEILRERVPHERLDWSGILDLPAGSYLLAETGHAEWACRLTLTNP